MEMDERETARTLGIARIVVGSAMFLMPNLVAKLWTGERADGVSADLGLRGMGARDVALGLGLVMALDRGAPVRGWLEAGVLSDSADAVGTLMNWRDLPAWRSLPLIAAEVGTALLGSRLAQELD